LKKQADEMNISQWELLGGTPELPAVDSKRMVGAEGQS
jgi:hypothetical protein